jgi:hypothetical protein
MQVTTWIDRITDESTLWLNALRSEEQGDYVRAATLYLRDASASLGQRLLVWGALSAACAADCLNQAGLPRTSKALHRESARIYWEKADQAALSSVREMIWSLRQSCEQFLLAGEGEMANEAYLRMSAVARRVDPFSVDAPMTLPGDEAAPEDGATDDPRYQGSEIVAEVERFLQSRKTGRYDQALPAGARGTAVTRKAKASSNEKSIVNQLG